MRVLTRVWCKNLLRQAEISDTFVLRGRIRLTGPSCGRLRLPFQAASASSLVRPRSREISSLSRYGPYTKLAFATLFLLLPLNIIALDHHDDFPLATKNDSQRVAQKVDELRMIKRFGFGVGAAGGLSVVGGEIDFHLTSDLSMALGIGTGLDYTTWNVKGKYYLSGQWVSPYFAAGIARWYTHGTAEKTVGPAVLRNVFLSSDHDYSKGFSVFIFYPAIGVQLMHASGFAVSVEGQYLFRLVNFANGTYAGAGVHWYF